MKISPIAIELIVWSKCLMSSNTGLAKNQMPPPIKSKPKIKATERTIIARIVTDMPFLNTYNA